MKDTPSQAQEDDIIAELYKDEAEEILAEEKPRIILTPAQRAKRKYKTFGILFLLISFTMLMLFVFYPPMIQSALMPGSFVMVVTCVLGILNLRRAANQQVS